MDWRYYVKTNENGKPILLFRIDPGTGVEEILGQKGFEPAPGFFEDIADGSFDYAPIPEEKAKQEFPNAFNA